MKFSTKIKMTKINLIKVYSLIAHVLKCYYQITIHKTKQLNLIPKRLKLNKNIFNYFFTIYWAIVSFVIGTFV